MAPSKKQNDWKKSISQKLLFDDIKSGAIPDGMDYKSNSIIGYDIIVRAAVITILQSTYNNFFHIIQFIIV